jgi:hypothetical protein
MPEFYMDPSDDNLLIGIPDEILAYEEQHHQQKAANKDLHHLNSGAVGGDNSMLESNGGVSLSGLKRAERLKLLENRTKMSKSILDRGKNSKGSFYFKITKNIMIIFY